ncbi:type I restriction enzyme subunit R domain-containing protein [Mesomycoplasma hyorhinis]|uniref:type I restriction enzyme subunit R domain-containing protein n=1 Tax=Mesomycoplasma hyorhinis TaxID=2100 RepID=UPI001C057DB0|nr:DEAD/DEAH box helicase family protein [Mesomycoplasma hyorhinis]
MLYKPEENEAKFEEKLISLLKHYGWENRDITLKQISDPFNNSELNDVLKKYSDNVLKRKDEQSLIENWKEIIYFRNRGELKSIPLSDSEMEQILDKVNKRNTVGLKNQFIINGEVSITRDAGTPETNPDYGKTKYLNIFSKTDVNQGKTIYQIAQQVVDKRANKRFDIVLLINGIPVIQIELKGKNNYAIDALGQIRSYHKAGVYKQGIFSLIQMFVAMDENEMFYTSNKNNADDIVNKDFIFKWTDEKNEKITYWKDIVQSFLNIPTSHNLVGIYSASDDKDIKILRPYQYWAIEAITREFEKNNNTIWNNKTDFIKKCGLIWHATGSGKTLTSFKTAQVLIDKNYADKVVFLADRIALTDQTFQNYSDFAKNWSEEVTNSKYTSSLKDFLLNSGKKLHISSHQKINNIAKELSPSEVEKINSKRIVFILDESHRSVFGETAANIKKTFYNSVWMGFTGTPIFEINKKGELHSQIIFGKILHTYTMKNAIIDNNVLGYSFKYVFFNDYNFWKYAYEQDILSELNYDFVKDFWNPNEANEHKKISKIEKVKQILESDKEFSEDYFSILHFENKNNEDIDKNEKLFEEFLEPNYLNKDEQWLWKHLVVKDILKTWNSFIAKENVFSAILATNRIEDAIAYFKIFQSYLSQEDGPFYKKIKVSALFDPNESYTGDAEEIEFKKNGVEEILKNYNDLFDTNWTIETFSNYKKDLTIRLAKKGPYQIFSNDNSINFNNDGKDHLDLVIVVNQLLTGFDSKFINTIFFDKNLQEEHLIQAISRTNRVFLNNIKPHGNVVFFNNPFKMYKNLIHALDIYGNIKYADVSIVDFDKDKIFWVVEQINENFNAIKKLFYLWDIPCFESIPSEEEQDNKILIKSQIEQFLLYWIKIYYFRLQLRNLVDTKEEQDFVNENVQITEKERKALEVLVREAKRRFKSIKADKFESPIVGEERLINDYISSFGKDIINKDNIHQFTYSTEKIKRLIKQDNTYELEKEIKKIIFEIKDDDQREWAEHNIDKVTDFLTSQPNEISLENFLEQEVIKQNEYNFKNWCEIIGFSQYFWIRELLNKPKDEIFNLGKNEEIRSIWDCGKYKQYLKELNKENVPTGCIALYKNFQGELEDWSDKLSRKKD